MSNPNGLIQSPDRLRAQAIAALIPFFGDGSPGDEKDARLTAESMLDEYHAGTPRELQLSTQIIAIGWTVLACLSAAATARNDSIDDMLRLQDYAIALNRTSHKMTKALEVRRKERARNPKAMTVENTKWDEGVFQLVINQALEKLTEANVRLAAFMTTLTPVEEKPKLSFLLAEQMTPDVLARKPRC